MPDNNRTSKPEEFASTPLLDTIERPSDVHRFSMKQLKALAGEIRRKIIATAAENGGHLAPHLGVVELTLALHHVYDTENDLVVWDVGHQCYTHKLLTGRKDQFSSIRRKGGLSGYPRISESRYDAFGTGHSSTSVSAALGMAVARDRLGEKRRIIAVIGDGAMTAGMAFEALAHAGHVGTDLLVVLNDNKMSISPNAGALSAYFSRLITGGLYTRAKGDVQSFMERVLGSNVTKAAQRLEHSVKGLITPGTLFQQLGFKYVGPVDGHDLPTLVDCFSNLKNLGGPVFFHCVTQKGKGYPYAEQNPLKYHGVNAFDIKTGAFRSDGICSGKESPAPNFTDAFADTLVALAQKDERIVGITAAMPTGTGLSKFEEAFPDRMFDVGICEQHAVTFAAGLATRGLRPVCAIYSTFLQRAYDQCVHDVCIQNLPVVFAVDRAGAVGEDSPTHEGAFDLSFLRVIPNMTLLAPRDTADLATMLRWALKQNGPVAIRYPRTRGPLIGEKDERGPITRAQVLREGKDAAILGVGPTLGACLKAALLLETEGVSVQVVDARCVKPLDTEMLDALAPMPIVTVEENALAGGFGSAVLEYFEQKGMMHRVWVRRLGFPDRFVEHSTRDEQIEEIGLDPKTIAAAVRDTYRVLAPQHPE
jgi:1-deoxy-D-xylulose-5-phosphate synthase